MWGHPTLVSESFGSSLHPNWYISREGSLGPAFLMPGPDDSWLISFRELERFELSKVCDWFVFLAGMSSVRKAEL